MSVAGRLPISRDPISSAETCHSKWITPRRATSARAPDARSLRPGRGSGDALFRFHALGHRFVRQPALWHFSVGGPDAERLVAGRARIYLDHFWNEFAGDPSKFDEASGVYYTKFYAPPGAMHSAFTQIARGLAGRTTAVCQLGAEGLRRLWVR